MIVSLTVGVIKRTKYRVSQIFPKSYRCFSGNVKVELNLFN